MRRKRTSDMKRQGTIWEGRVHLPRANGRTTILHWERQTSLLDVAITEMCHNANPVHIASLVASHCASCAGIPSAASIASYMMVEIASPNAVSSWVRVWKSTLPTDFSCGRQTLATKRVVRTKSVEKVETMTAESPVGGRGDDDWKQHVCSARELQRSDHCQRGAGVAWLRVSDGMWVEDVG